MTQPEDHRKEIVDYWWEKANASILSAEREFDVGVYSFAINRLYYALYYAVSAVLFERKLTFKKHSGVRAAFHRELVKAGYIDTKWGKLYDQLFEDRQEGDYVAMVEFEHSYVKTKLEQCKDFLDVLSKI